MIVEKNAANLIIINNNNEILVAKRSKINESREGDKWSIPGGRPKHNENFEDAIKREIKEELACTIKWFNYFKSYNVKLTTNYFVRVVYFYGEIEGEILLNKELSEYQWIKIDELENLKLEFAFNQKDILKEFAYFIKNK